MLLDSSARPRTDAAEPGSTTNPSEQSLPEPGRTLTHRRRSSWTLRRRAAAAAALGALVVAGALSFATYVLVRDYVVDQRVSSATRQALANARLLRDRLSVDVEPGGVLVEAVRTDPGGAALLKRREDWFSSSAGAGPNVLPETVARAVEAEIPGRQRAELAGAPALYVVVPMSSVDAVYVEVFPLRAAEDLLARLRNTLIVGAALAGLGGAALGAWSSRRALRPLTSVGQVAGAIAAGDLSRRIEPTADPDLVGFTDAFNHMTDELTDRLEREARFASDVSHELRTPLTSLALAAATLDRRRDELPGRSREALDIVLQGVDDLRRLVAELLELAQLDAASAAPEHPSIGPAVVLGDVVTATLERSGHGSVPVVITAPAAAGVLVTGAHRVERIVSNLAENADRHAGGLVSVTIAGDASTARLLFDDSGPGIAEADRERLFERFARGQSTQNTAGSGLGLSLVREHARQLGGSVSIEDRPGGGARFVVTIPARPLRDPS